MSLLIKLNDFRQKVNAVKKDAKNPFYKSNYATLEAVMETIEPTLNELRINYIQLIENSTLKTIVYDVDKEEDKIVSITPLLTAENDMQKLGSAITYARRYSLVSIFNLEQEDDDGNATLSQKVLNTFKGSKIVDHPSVETITQYIAEKQYMNVNGKTMYSYFEKNNWLDKQNKPVDWKKVIDWCEANPKK